MAVHWGGRGRGHTSRWTAAASGGTPTPPFAFPEDEMLLGMGLAGISSYTGYYPFANVLLNAIRWGREGHSNPYTSTWGEIEATNPTDVFVAKFGEGDGTANLPAGTYTVLNPDGLEIGIGWGGSPNITGWVTDLEFTFTKSGSVIALYAKGDVTNNNGPIQIIMPGLRDAYLAGNPWNPDFLTFVSGLGVEALRFMDWVQAYSDISEDWSDVPVGVPMTLNAPQTRQTAKVPYELIVDLANRLNIDPWINVPVRATNDFIDGLATYLRDNLNPGLHVHIEFGNETWNSGAAFNDGRVWVEHLFNTRYEATPNFGISGWTMAGHGLTTGDRVANFFTRENFSYTEALTVYPLGYGVLLYVEVTDANNFKLYEDVGRTVLVAPPTGFTKLVYKKHVEAGKTVNVDINHRIGSKNVWDRFDAILGRNRCVHIMASHAANATTTSNRLADADILAATDAVALALYYSGDWWQATLDIASGQVTPKAWTNRAGSTVRVAIYANGSTPTLAEVMAGTGTGYVGHRDITTATSNSSSFVSGTAITGLTNGTDYECFAVFTELAGYRWMNSAGFTASATTSTTVISDTDANMAARARRNAVEYLGDFVDATIAVSSGKPVIAYECGSDYIGAFQNTPATVKDWRSAWTNTEIAGEAFRHFYTTMAARGMVFMNQFVDINATPGVFNIAESFTDTSDYRYQHFVDFAGRIAQGTALAISNTSAPDVEVEPAYPAVVYTFPDATLTYSIFNGDVNGNFAIVGNELRIVNGNGIDWGEATARSLTIEAANSVTSDRFTLGFATGFAWYPADAQLAFDSIADNDSAAMNPIIGGTLNLTGTAPTISGGMWDFEATGRYNFASTLTSTIPGTLPILVAVVLDKDNQTANEVVFQAFATNFAAFYYDPVGGGRMGARWAAGGSNDLPFASVAPSGKHVFWTFYDADPTTPTIHVGVDQTENTAAALGKNLSAYTFSRNVYVGGGGALTATSKMKHGSILVYGKAGMALSDALDWVANMQTLHGI